MYPRKLNETVKLSLWVRLQLKVHGNAFLRWEKLDAGADYTPIYVVKCKEHGLFTDYPRGYNEYFACPECPP